MPDKPELTDTEQEILEKAPADTTAPVDREPAGDPSDDDADERPPKR